MTLYLQQKSNSLDFDAVQTSGWFQTKECILNTCRYVCVFYCEFYDFNFINGSFTNTKILHDIKTRDTFF